MALDISSTVRGNTGNVATSITQPSVCNSMHDSMGGGIPLNELCEELRNSLEYVSLVNNGLTKLNSSVPNVVFFDVEHQRFAVHKRTLEKDPQSLLFILVNNHFTPYMASSTDSGPVKGRKRVKLEASQSRLTEETNDCPSHSSLRDYDSSRIIKIRNRNPEIFEKLLNFLRGYKSAIPLEWAEVCKIEAYFYGLQSSWNKSFSTIPKSHFSKTFSESSKQDTIHCDTLWTLIGEVMERGTHMTEFSTFGDSVGFGVIHRAKNDYFAQGTFCSRPNVFYCTDEKIRKISENSAIHKIMDVKRSADNPLDIRMSFDADDAIIRWDRFIGNGWCTAGIHHLTNEITYGFCVLSTPGAQVSIKS